MRNRRRPVFVTVLILLFIPSVELAAENLERNILFAHPMDALNAEEYQGVVAILTRAGRVDSTTRYPLITLNEPPKKEVLDKGFVSEREAFVIVKQGSNTYEAVVSLSKKTVLSWKYVAEVQPSFIDDDWLIAQKIVRANPEWQSAVRKRDIKDLSKVVCIPLTTGFFGNAENHGKRLFKVITFDGRGTRNFWARPIEGLIAIVDVNRREVVDVIDTGVIPIPQTSADFTAHAIGKRRLVPTPIAISQPKGPSFKIKGNEVSWQKWRFHMRIDPRLGPILSLVSYKDNGRFRSILYQASVSEMFVPYMDPSLGWYFRAWLDAGEFGIGNSVSPLQPGLDAPLNASYFDAVFADQNGSAYTKKRAACIFERYSGEISWRHHDHINGQLESRPARELVLRLISSIGNYDYIFDWVFRQDGSIKVAIGSTGIVQIKAVPSQVATSSRGQLDTSYGRLVAPGTVAVNHDHFFSFRMDFDIDGPENSLLIDRLTAVTLEPENPRRSIWVLKPEVALNEANAKLRINLKKPAMWRVINKNVKGKLGYPVSYRLMSKQNAISLLASDDYPQRRAAFTDNHLWVTPFNSKERYAAGTYVNQSRGGQGLPKWTLQNRSILNTDIVLWFTLGFHHVVRSEDWPVMPTGWHEFELRPFDFFDRNPALDLPKRP